jgi:DNA polymerase V
MHVTALWAPGHGPCLLRPLFVDRVSAGAPATAEDLVEGFLDLNRYLIRNPAATFYVRVNGDSMTEAGIRAGDILIVDRAAVADDGDIIIARLDDELTVKRLRIRAGEIWLESENEAREAVRITKEMRFEVWGKVMHIIRSL